jgi:DNA-binding MarR family transcriptional regulator
MVHRGRGEQKSVDFIDAFSKLMIPGEDKITKIDERVTGETILLNTQRQLILQYLSKYPCNHMNGIVRDLGLSYPTVKWHIDLMIKQEFVSYKNIGNKNVFFPYNMIADKDIELFTFLNKDKARVLYSLLINKPGLTQKEICTLSKMSNRTVISYLMELVDYGFINVRKDGIYRRYYPSNLINELMNSYRDRMNSFRKEIKRKLIRDGLNPIIVRAHDNMLQIQIGDMKDTSILKIYANPIMTLLSKEESDDNDVRSGVGSPDAMDDNDNSDNADKIDDVNDVEVNVNDKDTDLERIKDINNKSND